MTTQHRQTAVGAEPHPEIPMPPWAEALRLAKRRHDQPVRTVRRSAEVEERLREREQ